MRKIIRQFENGACVPTENLNLKDFKIKRVYTIIDNNILHLSESELLKLNLVHNSNVFMESFVDDWQIRKGRFYFYGHSGKKGQSHDLLIDYMEAEH